MGKKTDEKPIFDFNKKLDDLQIPNMLKEGFRLYVEIKNIEIKSDKDFETKMEEYKNLKIGD